MPLPRSFRVALTFGVVAALWSAPAHAVEAELDVPSVDQSIQATTVIHLNVTAGVSGAPNGFTIEWMSRSIFDQLGGWPTDPNDPRIHSAIYVGAPSLNITEGTTSFLLGPGQTAKVEIGDIFDETGVLASNVGEMQVGTQYAVRIRANGDGGTTGGGGSIVYGETSHMISPSPYSGTYYAQTKSNAGLLECVHSQGYWKNHPDAWPVSSLRLGNVIYSKNQLLAIWDTPAAGNGLISLAHQLMAAKLNLMSGAQAPANLFNAVGQADALIGNRIVPPVGSGFLSPGSTSSLTDRLETFNTEEGVDIQCAATTPSKLSTWGSLKAMYR